MQMQFQGVQRGIAWGFAFFFAAPSYALPKLHGSLLRSKCTPVVFRGVPMHSRLAIQFVSRGSSLRYASNETLYSDDECQISVLRTKTFGTWRTRENSVLTLLPSSLKLIPLDPRIADDLDARRACGKRWLNGEANEISRTHCGKERVAQYFVDSRKKGSNKRRSMEFYDCEGKNQVDPTCTRYEMLPYRRR